MNHSHTGGGSFRSKGRPRRTCPINDAVVLGAGSLESTSPGEASTLTLHKSFRAPWRRKSPRRRRAAEEEEEEEGAAAAEEEEEEGQLQVVGVEETLRSRERGGGKLVLALEPRRDLAAPS